MFNFRLGLYLGGMAKQNLSHWFLFQIHLD
jgi:hypothetical protein